MREGFKASCSGFDFDLQAHGFVVPGVNVTNNIPGALQYPIETSEGKFIGTELGDDSARAYRAVAILVCVACDLLSCAVGDRL